MPETEINGQIVKAIKKNCGKGGGTHINTFNSLDGFYLNLITKLIGTGVRDSCGKSASRGDPAGESRGGSPTDRGKRCLERKSTVFNYKSYKKQ
ncbi:hypothetical protein EI200_01625 [Peribacillus simplex]|nr:hypothetical protein EI200_01625 [Peribacillus simplex]